MLYLQTWINVFAATVSSSLQAKRPSKGQGLIEYALVIALVAVVAVVGLTLLGSKLSQTFSNAVQNLNLPNPAATPTP